jgi:hypothetical protein
MPTEFGPYDSRLTKRAAVLTTAKLRKCAGIRCRRCFHEMLRTLLREISVMTPFVLRNLLAVAASMTIGLAAAHGQEWPRLPDGRILITVKDFTLALPTKGSDLQDIKFNADRHRMNLGDVIAAPAKARQFFADNKIRNVLIPNLYNRHSVFLGRFDRKKLYNFVFSVEFGSEALANCEAWSRTFSDYRKELVAKRMPTDANGWGEFSDPRSPPRTYYVRANDIAGLPQYFDSFACNSLNSCVATACMNSKASFVYRFPYSSHKRDTWNDVVRNAAAVYRFLFDYGDMQKR